tara:strand:+ start:100 stop:465 length:366 start_codon:yes stop_codon:yes gene_type:complete
MEYQEKHLRDFVPEWNDNRDKDEADQVVVKLAPMTGGELRSVHRSAVTKDGKVDFDKAHQAIEKIIRKRVSNIENLVDILDEPVTDGSQLWDRAEQGLIDEVYAAITEASVLREGLKKKSI